MPLYEYQCQECKAVRDIRHGFDETTTEKCQACGGPLTRLFRPAGIVFKGSGFYITDSRKNSGSSAGGSGAPSASTEPAKTEAAPAKSESPAPSPAPKSDAPAA